MYQFVISNKVKMKVQGEICLYLSDANSIIKQLKDKEKIKNGKCKNQSKGKRKR